MSFRLSANKRCLSANKRCLSAPDATSIHQQEAKTDMLSVVSIHVLCTVEEGWLMLAYDLPCTHEAVKVLHLLNRGRWHIPKKSPYPRLTTGPLVSNA